VKLTAIAGNRQKVRNHAASTVNVISSNVVPMVHTAVPARRSLLLHLKSSRLLRRSLPALWNRSAVAGAR
jgi:hypothetical protein